MTKRFLIPCIIAVTALFSCTKDDNPPTPAGPPSKMELLTSKQWIYSEIYQNYKGDSATATLYYKRGVTNNPHFDSERDIFWPNGQLDVLWDNDNTWATGKWAFTTDSSHYLYTPATTASAHTTILLLDETHFNYWDTDHATWGKMVPKQ